MVAYGLMLASVVALVLYVPHAGQSLRVAGLIDLTAEVRRADAEQEDVTAALTSDGPGNRLPRRYERRREPTDTTGHQRPPLTGISDHRPEPRGSHTP